MFQIPDFTGSQWLMLLVAAFCSGMSKAGLAGISMLGVTLTTMAIGGWAATGVVLPLLIFADVLAATTFRKQVDWVQIRRLALPIGFGLVLGWLALMGLKGHHAVFRPMVGWVILGLVCLEWLRHRFPSWEAGLPRSMVFAWFAGILTGITTMVANAAGPVASIYLLILALPKLRLISTMAWLFLFVNLAKVPFSLQLGLINGGSLSINLCQAPAVVLGLMAGKKLVTWLPQSVFQKAVLFLALVSAVWLVVG